METLTQELIAVPVDMHNSANVELKMTCPAMEGVTFVRGPVLIGIVNRDTFTETDVPVIENAVVGVVVVLGVAVNIIFVPFAVFDQFSFAMRETAATGVEVNPFGLKPLAYIPCMKSLLNNCSGSLEVPRARPT